MNTNTPKNNSNTQNKHKKRNVVVLVLMFLLLLCLFIAQCQLDKIKQEALRKEQETELEARQKHILDSLRLLEKMRADSLAALEAARIADSIRIADSLAALDTVDNTPKPTLNRDSIRHVRDSLAALEKARQDSLQRIADSLAAIEKARADSIEKQRLLDSIRAADGNVVPSSRIFPITAERLMDATPSSDPFSPRTSPKSFAEATSIP